jgi:glutamyl-tRNA synthetase
MLRFAPSPTGDMQLGNLRVAILNYLVALQRNENFLIRINDTDKTKNIEGKDTEIMQILEKFALIHESVFHQSEHLHMHQTMAIKLLEQEKAFVCICSEEEIEAEKKEAKKNSVDYCYSGKCEMQDKAQRLKLKESGTPFVLRLKNPMQDIRYHDMIKGDVTVSTNDIDAFIILDTNGMPTENFAAACDDMLSGITMIICEDTHLIDTAREIHIKKQLGFDAEIQHAQIPAISNCEDTSTVEWFFKHGYIPNAIINYLLLLGNDDTPQEIFTLPDAMAWFKLENISKSTATFDMDKLRYINREHLKCMEDKQLSSLFGFADADIGKLAKLYLEEVSTTTELTAKINPIFSPKKFEGKWSNQMRIIEKLIQNAPMFSEFNAFKSYIIKESGLEDENFSTPLRLLLTGEEEGPELSDIYTHIKSYLLEIAS